MIEVNRVTKRFGHHVALDDVSLQVLPGRVTGFLGPNGAGKSTTMRVILGLDHATSGATLINGLPLREHRFPLRQAGAVLDGRGLHPGRTGRHHLLALAATHGVPRSRVRDLLEMVRMEDRADERAGGYSLGMSQRVGLAAALLGDPPVLILDEPVNGLDPSGIHWMRGLVRSWAAEGRTVLVSSHLLSEMELMADHVVVLNRGRVVADGPLRDLTNLDTSLEEAYLKLTESEEVRP